MNFCPDEFIALRYGTTSTGLPHSRSPGAPVCHTHSGEGSKVGPDVTGMAVHPKIELLTNILYPSRSVEGNFRAYWVANKDGRTLTPE